MPDEKFDEFPNLVEGSLDPFNAAGIVRFEAKIAPSAARREVLYYCTMAVLCSEAQSYLAVWSNKSVVGGTRGLKEELYDGERAYARSKHQWGA